MSASIVQIRIRVWDRFVRICHWSLVACVLTNYYLVDDGEGLHQWLGYVASGLVGGRIVWGFAGRGHARFADFFPTPRRVVAHLRELGAGRGISHDGHNPLGAIMMLTLLAIVLLLGLTGFLQTTDRFWGEEWLMEMHEAFASALMLFAGVHAAAAILMSRIERTNLIMAMVTGVKVRRSGVNPWRGRHSPILRLPEHEIRD